MLFWTGARSWPAHSFWNMVVSVSWIAVSRIVSDEWPDSISKDAARTARAWQLALGQRGLQISWCCSLKCAETLCKASGIAGCGSTGGRYCLLADVRRTERHFSALSKGSHVSALGAFYLASQWQLGAWQSFFGLQTFDARWVCTWWLLNSGKSLSLARCRSTKEL